MTKLVIQEDVPFSELGSYRIGGPVQYFASARSEEEIKEAITLAKKNNWPIFVLGGGTNLLVNDDGLRGLVLKPDLQFIERDGNTLRVGAGVLFSELLDYAIQNNLGGMEWAGGLPGTVGGAVRGNAGCFGSETKDLIQTVESIDLQTGDLVTRDKESCQFDYRSSIFKKELNGREIITAVVFDLFLADPIEIKRVADDHIRYRKERQPLEYPNIGSIFKNVDARGMNKEELAPFSHVLKNDPFPVIPAAYLIAESGLKGVSHGGAIVSEKHPNFIVNALGATASDVQSLIQLVREKVKEKFDIDLEPEIIQI